ncbi:nuclear transport factor 2 family protein [Lysobacter sp. FW306-1B-D06B]|uniref:nuclear transport factor 2 family protein n=1 Tax=Lysobacter sp. FW306-1B-D06B TaxID=3140250 RepID=UPI0031404D4E
MSTQDIARRLVELCRAGAFEQALEELYADDAVSIEPDDIPPGALSNAEGLDAILRKSRRFWGGVETLHSVRCSEPLVAARWFSTALSVDVTFKGVGRIDIREICVYRVRDGRIVLEQFFYDTYEP